MNKFKLSISNIAWEKSHDSIVYTLLSEFGYNGIEIAPTRLLENPYDNIQSAKKIVESIHSTYGLEISSIQSILYGKSERIFNTKEERMELINYCKKAIVFASEINCNNLVFGSPKNRIMSSSEDYKVAIEFFNMLGNFSTENNVTLSIEANPKIYGTNFITNTLESIELVQNVNSNGFKVNLDLGTVIYNNEDINFIKKYINLINHVHVSEPNLEVIKASELHNCLYEVLSKCGYSKYVSIEMKKTSKISEIKQVLNYVKNVFGGSNE